MVHNLDEQETQQWSDKAAIKKHLTAGETIEGAVLHTGPQSISIRMK